MKKKLENSFDYKELESRIYCESLSYIKKTAEVNRRKEVFTIILPPPNITGFLHIGHAFTSTLQDILLRFKRQQGYVTLGQPGIDHAGIATQIVVEKQLKELGIARTELGREKFLEKVWEWKESSGGQIINQLKSLGMSVDWDRLRFTMDLKSSKSVLQAFVSLYNDGLIYKAQQMVNWDTVLKTAISDLEVDNREEKGKLWYIRYIIEGGGEKDYLVVATTRPETMFGDTAVAINPADERYRHLVGKNVCVPLTNRKIPIITDEHCDMEKGTGAVKITPAHDFNDFEVGKRHNLPIIDIMNEEGILNNFVPEPFQGISCKEARGTVCKALEEANLLDKVEDIIHSVPYSDRSNSIVEPRITKQWFLDMSQLAKDAIKAVENGKIKFISDQWKATYYEWLNNIHPWCISRQIWWGHQIPVWYLKDGSAICALNYEEARKLAAEHCGCTESELPELEQETDVLDTWFSSALWPFSTQGWPEKTDFLERYYPSSVLVTAFDIIFFWVARMIMFGLYFMKDVPFSDVYIHPLVRDEKGKKMSKSKGNVVDPLSLMEKYGTDAMRFSMAIIAVPGSDIRISEALVENNRNFITKIWNAAKFLEMKECFYNSTFSLENLSLDINKWLIRKLVDFKEKVFSSLECYRFDYAAQNISKFLREVFCDVYIESVKPYFEEDTDLTEEIRIIAAFVFVEFLKIAHPLIPFVTEYLNEFFCDKGEKLIVASLLELDDSQKRFLEENYKEDLFLVQLYIDLAAEIRSIRGMLNVPQTIKQRLYLEEKTDESFIKRNKAWICSLGRLEDMCFSKNANGIKIIIGERDFCLQYPSNISAKETNIILKKKISDFERDCITLERKLQNEMYKKAKPEAWKFDEDLLIQKKSIITKLKTAVSS